jgi:geranylgeranyl pyrophosphate synthase
MNPSHPVVPGKTNDPLVARIDTALDRYSDFGDGCPAELRAAIRYSLLAPGKRLRPRMVILSARACGEKTESALPAACAVEMVHAYSLIHDDLPAMDDDDLRRGRPTAHLAFDEATAILAADALQPLAFSMLADAPALQEHPAAKIQIIRLIAEACGSLGMTGGQAIDIAAEGGRLDPAELEHMYRLKTGQLLRASVLSAAYCPPACDIAELHALERFVDYMGLAFQIRDDILDIEGSTEEIGKQQGADIAHEKATYPAMIGLDEARQRADELLQNALSALDEIDRDTESLRYLARLIVLRRT